jgi:DNA invertase Pin-like site-specific DNA recombinase
MFLGGGYIMEAQRAALYIRVSTEDQLEFSPDAQKRALLEYAKRNNFIIEENYIYIDEGISGRNAKNRPAFQQMIKIAKSKPIPFDIILVHKFDRFARSREDSVVYKALLRRECKIQVISITEQFEDDKFSVIMEAMLEAMAEYYSLNLADEVKKGMTEKAKRGGFMARCPLGYKIVEKGKLPQIVPEEAEIIKLIFHKFVNEDYTYQQIINYLNDSGFHSKNGNRFEKRNIKYILQNPLYAGYTRWNYRKNSKLNPSDEWIIAKGSHEAIISKETFDHAVAKVKKIQEMYDIKHRPSNEYKHWLSGMMKCAYCGGAMTYTPGSKNYAYYRCNKRLKGSCDTPNSLSLQKLEKAILEKLKSDIAQIDSLDVEQIQSIQETDEIGLIEKQLKKTRRKYDLAKKAFLTEIDSLEEYKENKVRIQKEETDLLSQLDKLKSKPSPSKQKGFFTQITSAYKILISENATIEEKNKALRSFVKKIAIDAPNETIDIEYYYDERSL